MKKVIVLITLSFFVFAGFSQSGSSLKKAQASPAKEKIKIKEIIIMKDEKVWLMKNGKNTIIDNETTMGGIRVKPDGAVILKDGSQAKLKDGDSILTDGKIERAADENMPDKKHE